MQQSTARLVAAPFHHPTDSVSIQMENPTPGAPLHMNTQPLAAGDTLVHAIHHAILHAPATSNTAIGDIMPPSFQGGWHMPTPHAAAANVNGNDTIIAALLGSVAVEALLGVCTHPARHDPDATQQAYPTLLAPHSAVGGAMCASSQGCLLAHTQLLMTHDAVRMTPPFEPSLRALLLKTLLLLIHPRPTACRRYPIKLQYPQSMARTKKIAHKVEVPFQGAPSKPKVNEQTTSKLDEQRQSNVDEKNKSRSKVPFGKAK
ncbi:hypothetical protein L7F22_000685, partial [Adiantum nelumboides]|nr:hypothetical protein [Adiantum nelumboides]